MKKHFPCRQIFALLLTLSLVLPLFGSLGAIGTFADSGQPAGQTQDERTPKKKIVSVLYDDSISMRGDNQHNARYASQMLIALLNSNDELYITPMNQDSKKIELDLKKKSRNEAIQDALDASLFIADGQTPIGSVDTAIQVLTDRDMSTFDPTAPESENEYWLIILTDGEFQNDGSVTHYTDKTDFLKKAINQKTTVKKGDESIPYSGLRTVYIAFGSNAPDLSKSNLNNQTTFSAYLAAESKDIVGVMQQVAAKITGRYQTTQDKDFTAFGNTLTIRPKAAYATNSVSVIVQNIAGNSLDDIKPKKITYNGEETALTVTQECRIDASGTGLGGAYSAVLRPGEYENIQGGEIKLTFKDGVDLSGATVTVLFEPSLSIEPFVTFQGVNDIQPNEISAEEINALCKPGDKIRVGYRTYTHYFDKEKGQEVTQPVGDLSKLFDSVEASITYNGNTVGSEIPLVAGNGEIVVHVTCTVGEAKYSLFGTVNFTVDEDPNWLTITPTVREDPEDPQNPAKYSVEFSAKMNEAPLRFDSLGNEHLLYKLVVTDSAGKQVSPASEIYTVPAPGETLCVKFDLLKCPDSYTITATIDSDGSVTTNKTHKVGVAQIDPQYSIDGALDLSGKMEFTLSINGKPVDTSAYPEGGWQLSVTDSAGKEVPFQKAPAGLSASYNGTGRLPYDEYTVAVTVGKVTGSQTVSVYPQVLELTMTPENGDLGAIKQHALEHNQTGVTYLLKADGEAIDFNSPLFSYELTLGGVNVTNSATVAGNTLTYIPQTAHAEKELSLAPGAEQKQLSVTLTVKPKSGSAAQVSKTASFTLVKTVYELVPVPVLQKEIDRFNIDGSNAGVYFQLLRDGEEVGEAEMRDYYESGQFKVKLPAAMSFLLPCGAQTGIETVNGKPLLYCKAVKDQPGVLSWLTSMLLFNGSKNITVQLLDAEGVDSVVFTPSPFFQYLWRILLLALIIYTIIYIIGFFTRRMLPKGVFVTINVASPTVRAICQKINLSPWDVIWWHFKRFFIGPLRNQTPIEVQTGTMSITKEGFLSFTLESRGKAIRADYEGDCFGFDTFMKALKEDLNGELDFKIRDEHGELLIGEDLLGYFSDSGNEITTGKKISLSPGQYFKLFTETPSETGFDNTVERTYTRIMFFVKK